MIDGTLTEENADNGILKVENTTLAGNTNDFEVAVGSTWDIAAWFNTEEFDNEIYDNVDDIMLEDPFSATSPSFMPQAGSPLLGTSDFSAAELTDTFFVDVSYRGAFDSTTNWTSCWANWDPQNTDYTIGSTAIGSAIADFGWSVDSNTVTFVNFSENGESYLWSFGFNDSTGAEVTSTEASPTVVFPTIGSFEVSLEVTGACADVSESVQQVDLTDTTGNPGDAVFDLVNIEAISLYPNPAKNIVNVDVTATVTFDAAIDFLDITGRMVLQLPSKTFTAGKNSFSFDVADLQSGIYFLTLLSANEHRTVKLVIAK